MSEKTELRRAIDALKQLSDEYDGQVHTVSDEGEVGGHEWAPGDHRVIEHFDLDPEDVFARAAGISMAVAEAAQQGDNVVALFGQSWMSGLFVGILVAQQRAEDEAERQNDAYMQHGQPGGKA